MYLIETRDSRLIERELPVNDRCATDDTVKPGNSFFIDPENQFSDNSGVYYQPVSERNADPLPLKTKTKFVDGKNDAIEQKTRRRDIFKQTFRQKQMEGIEEVDARDRWNKVVMIAGMFCGTTAVIAVVRMLAG